MREASRADIPALLHCMRALAEFEGYAPDFRVTEAVLRQQGFGDTPPDFRALVIDGDDGLRGMLVYYLVPFTFRARPTLYIKELYVAEPDRGRGVGEALMRKAASRAIEARCAAMKWQVARWNVAAMRFYHRLGATEDDTWVDYGMTESTLRDLVGDS